MIIVLGLSEVSKGEEGRRGPFLCCAVWFVGERVCWGCIINNYGALQIEFGSRKSGKIEEKSTSSSLLACISIRPTWTRWTTSFRADRERKEKPFKPFKGKTRAHHLTVANRRSFLRRFLGLSLTLLDAHCLSPVGRNHGTVSILPQPPGC